MTNEPVRERVKRLYQFADWSRKATEIVARCPLDFALIPPTDYVQLVERPYFTDYHARRVTQSHYGRTGRLGSRGTIVQVVLALCDAASGAAESVLDILATQMVQMLVRNEDAKLGMGDLCFVSSVPEPRYSSFCPLQRDGPGL